MSACNDMRLPGCRFLCRHIAFDPAPTVVPAMSLARSNALHSTQKPTVPPTHEMFGLETAVRGPKGIANPIQCITVNGDNIEADGMSGITVVLRQENCRRFHQFVLLACVDA